MTPGLTPAQATFERSPRELKPHPEARRVPAMPAAEYAAFRADLERRGLQVPLEITKSGIVLDGRERLRAALELGLERVVVQVVAPVDELDHMLRAAILRRQLTASQKAALALGLLERMYPQASKLEMFARSRRPGWSAWGNQLPPASSADPGAAGR